MSKRNAIQYVQNEEPAFIRQFKQKVGYKEGPDVNTKRQRLECEEDEDRSDTEEEKPTVVLLNPGDLTAEEATEVDKMLKKQEEEAAIQAGKITFKKPSKKREGSATDGATDEPASKPSATDKGKSKDRKKKDKEQKKASSLLSFGDKEEEEEG